MSETKNVISDESRQPIQEPDVISDEEQHINDLMAQAWDEGQMSGMRHAGRLAAAAQLGKPDLPGSIIPNPYRRTL